jgi:hypothetical protein
MTWCLLHRVGIGYAVFFLLYAVVYRNQRASAVWAASATAPWRRLDHQPGAVSDRTHV